MTLSPPRLHLVTGATGLLGSHIAERLVGRGDKVRALVRPTSDVRFLQSLGVELVVGDLNNPSSLQAAASGVETIYHCAAKVGDWGKWREFQTDCIDATRNLALAAIDARVGRFLHISSTSAYGHPIEGGPPIDETAELGQNLWPIWDGYTISKVEAERTLWRLVEEKHLPLTVIRPSWLYGERDRITLKRLVTRLRANKIPLIGPGDNPLSAIYAGNVADAAILAANDPGSVGEAYNITHQGQLTQREFLDLFAGAARTKPPARSISYPLVFAVALGFEAVGHVLNRTKPPLITRYATWLMGRQVSYSTRKAEDRLGWRPAVNNRTSIDRSVAWYLEQLPENEADRRQRESRNATKGD